MKIAIVGASGKSGHMILEEALRRRMDCTAFVRNPQRLDEDVPFVERDVFAITREDIAPFDVVVSAFGNDKNKSQQQHVEVAQHYLSIFMNTGKRLIYVGAGGHLYTDETRRKKLYDKVWMKLAGIRPGALILEQCFLTLKKAEGFHWTYLAPPVYYVPNGERTGNYRVGTDFLLKSSKGKSQISYADYAVALVDEIEQAKHIDCMYTVVAH